MLLALIKKCLTEKKKENKDQENAVCCKCHQSKGFLIKVKTIGTHYNNICLDCNNKNINKKPNKNRAKFYG